MSSRRNKPAPLKLYMWEGSFFTADDGAAPAMNGRVWRRLPEELIWEVLRFVPLTAYFRWQLVSRKWRQVLTSSNFRNTLLGALSSRQSEQEQRVVAGLAPKNGYCDEGASSSSNRGKVKVVDIDLTSFVPRSFWKSSRDQPYSYSVVAAANGLVCIRVVEKTTQQFCVLNPLTRTCKVLPQVPFKPWGWLPPTPTTLTMFGYMCDEWRQGEVGVATYDLAAAAASDSGDGSGGWDWAAYRLLTTRNEKLAVAMCAGETLLFHDARLHVLAPRAGDGRVLEEVAALNQPSRTRTTGLRAHGALVRLVAHRGTVFLVNFSSTCEAVMVMEVWRLARERLEWEAVSRLDVAELEGLTGLMCGPLRMGRIAYAFPCHVYGVQEFVYCTVRCSFRSETSPKAPWVSQFILRLNLDTAEWELVHDDGQPTFGWTHFTNGLELRPDLFL